MFFLRFFTLDVIFQFFLSLDIFFFYSFLIFTKYVLMGRVVAAVYTARGVFTLVLNQQS